MPTDPPKTKVWLDSFIVHLVKLLEAPERKVHVGGKLVKAILDSSNSVSLVQTQNVKPRPGNKLSIPIIHVHGDTCYVPAQTVTISSGSKSWPVEVRVVKDLPVPVLIKEHLASIQQAQQCLYKWPAQAWGFQLGEKVLVLVP